MASEDRSKHLNREVVANGGRILSMRMKCINEIPYPCDGNFDHMCNITIRAVRMTDGQEDEMKPLRAVWDMHDG